MTGERELAPGQWSALALLAEQPGHGWALARELSRSGEMGRVWAVGRALVYRSLDLLEQRGLIERIGREPGERGPSRRLFQATGEGRAELRRWLAEPVDHVHEFRSLLLLKLVLIERAGLEAAPLLSAQRALVAPAVRTLEERLRESTGAESVLVRFRLETTRAVLEFIDGLLDGGAAHPGAST